MVQKINSHYTPQCIVTLSCCVKLLLLHLFQNGCHIRRPPGCEIYRQSDGSLSVFEVDGSAEDSTAIEYCTNLLLLAELFIGHESLSVCATAPTTSLRFHVLTRHSDVGECLTGFVVKVRVLFITFTADVVIFSDELTTSTD